MAVYFHIINEKGAMKHLTIIQISMLSAIVMLLSSCEIVGDIFQACMWIGIIAVVLVAGLVMWLISKVRRH